MLELSLFTGAGGGLLGTKLLGWKCVGAVEQNKYCVRVLNTRQREGNLDEFPIWAMDIREFNERVAERYRGMVDVITAGFPCQPFSVAGQQRGEDDPRNMWPATIDCIRRVRPRFVFLENVPGLLTGHGYFGRILSDLAESGYNVRWRCLSAGEMGAPHKRTRLWILAHTTNSRCLYDMGESKKCGKGQARHSAPPSCIKREVGLKNRGNMAITKQRGLHAIEGWWVTEPQMGRVADGVADRVDQIKAIGNGQVPAVVATAWDLLNEE